MSIAPSNYRLIYAVHDRGIGDDAQQVGGQTPVEGSRAFL